MRTLNLGILAHVDAGKTSLTERLLHAVGVTDELGSVDAGSTRTDALALERERGITIRSAVASFAIDDVTVNLIDTPGHPDFIAEVERVLHVLEGAVLVVSAVEGVQAQTRILWRTLRRLGIPTLLFVNKIDRRGARDATLLEELARRLTPDMVAVHDVHKIGQRDAAVTARNPADPAFVDELAELVADHDDQLLVDYLDGTRAVDVARLRAAMAAASRRGKLHAVLFGSAITGAGIDLLIPALTELLPTEARDRDAPLSGTVFKIDRGPAGEKRAYVRVFTGSLQVRDRITLRGTDHKVTGIEVFEDGATVARGRLPAGRIGLVRGLGDVRIGDAIGASGADPEQHFAPPSLEAIVDPVAERERGVLRAALSELEEQDPLIGVRQDDDRQEIHVSLYGEVQKQVIEATLRDDHGVEVTFRETTTICVERPTRSGSAVEFSAADGRTDEQPFLATVGIRVDPAPVGSGVTYLRSPEVLGTMPASFFTAVEGAVHAALRHGVRGWEVTDAIITLTHTGYWPRQSASHQSFDRAVSSTASDFRNLTPLVLMQALKHARTVVCEPIHRFHLEVPADALGAVVPATVRHRAVPWAPRSMARPRRSPATSLLRGCTASSRSCPA
jgi:ribosomal protection tetracycline resistance protein